jgi:MYXO-CTERM domain-containing protein
VDQSCRDGLPLAPGADMVCNRAGGPEKFAEQASRLGQLESRTAAPFRGVAPGAYAASVQQRAAVGVAGSVAGSGGTWKPVGGTPECAGPSTTGSVCPPASADNGNYPEAALGMVQLSGRVTSFAADPAHAEHLWVSAVAGGVFETVDSGGSWTSIGDRLPTQVVGAIAYDAPTRTLLVGTGDNSFGGSGISGHGIYLSRDDGATWTAAAGLPDLALSFRIVISPNDTTGNTVYAATSKGLFRSKDGGASFTNMRLPTTPVGYQPNCAGDTTSPLCFFASIVTDVVVRPALAGGRERVIAAVGWRAGATPDKDAAGNQLTCGSSPCVQSPQNGIYVNDDNTHPDAFRWTGSASTGFAPNNIAGRTALGGVTGAGQNPDAVYALVEDVVKFNGCPDYMDTAAPVCVGTLSTLAATVLDGLYASYNFGASWIKVMDWSQLRGGFTNSALASDPTYAPGIQAWYNLNVVVDPTATDSNNDPTRVVFGLEELWQNNNSLISSFTGQNPLHTPWQQQKTFNQIPTQAPWVVFGRYWNACAVINTGVPCNPSNLSDLTSAVTTTHPDQHAEVFVPDGRGGVTIYAGSDGGVFKQHVASGGIFDNQNWGDGVNVGLHTQQPYDAGMAKDGTVVSGLQDNGEVKITPDGHQYEIHGGDGFFTTIDPNNSKNILEEYTYGTVNGTNDGGNSWFPTDSDATGLATCGSSTALFATPIEQDPTMPGHVVIGCTSVQEATQAYTNTCADPVCGTNSNPFTAVFNLGTAPGGRTNNIPSAIGVRGAGIYIGYCGYCDVVTGGLPFHSGIATNVGGTQPPQSGTSNGWHFAAAHCTGCGTSDGTLPQRYITSIQMDPADASTVYVTLGGYGRRWIPPGALGDDVSKVGTGHVFKSVDHGENFVDITGNLPDAPANWTLVHNGQLVVATDIGMFISDPSTPLSSFAAAGSGGPHYATLGSGLPVTPVFTLRQSPADPNVLLIATFGRGDYTYTFPAAAGTSPVTTPTPPTGASPIGLPNAAADSGAPQAGMVGLGVLGLIGIARRRRRRMS